MDNVEALRKTYDMLNKSYEEFLRLGLTEDENHNENVTGILREIKDFKLMNGYEIEKLIR